MSTASTREQRFEKVYDKVRPFVEKMKARYPAGCNIEGLEPALSTDITEIVLSLIESEISLREAAAVERGRNKIKFQITDIYHKNPRMSLAKFFQSIVLLLSSNDTAPTEEKPQEGPTTNLGDIGSSLVDGAKRPCCKKCLIHLPYKERSEYQCNNVDCECHRYRPAASLITKEEDKN